MSTTVRPPVTGAPQLLRITSTARTWVRKIWGGGQIVEACPDFCTGHGDHQARSHLTDLAHVGEHVAFELPVWDAVEGSIDMPVLSARLYVSPYDDAPAEAVPHIVFEPWQDEPMTNLDPDEFAAVIAQIRAHCDRLDQVHAQLVAARNDWNAVSS